MRLAKGLCVTREESKYYYEIGEFMKKKKKNTSFKVAKSKCDS